MNGIIIKTTNRGINWITLTDSLNVSWVTDIQYHNETTGWLVGSSGNIRKTTNGGINWFFANYPECSNCDDFLQIQFLNESTGYAYGDQRIFKSTDSGLNWSPLELLNIPVWVLRGQFLNPLTGWVVGGYYSFARTTNGGLNWIQNYFVNIGTTDVFFINNNTGWIVSYFGAIYKTTNGGDNWASQFNDTSKIFDDITFTSVDTGWAIGYNRTGSFNYGFVIKTTNSGLNWLYQQVPNTPYREIFMLNSNEGWVVGGAMLHTTDGGSVGVKQISAEQPEKYQLFQNYPNPFNSSTKINYSISKKSYIKLEVFDINGRMIKELDEGEKNIGVYEVIFDANYLASGIYYYKFTSKNYFEVKKLVLIK